MIVLFDANTYDKLLDLSHEKLQIVLDKVTTVVMPQLVEKQLNRMIEDENKIEKLSKINKIIADLDVAEKLNKKFVETHQNQKEIYFDSLPGKMKNGDKEIALSAKEEGATLITNDRGCLEGLRSIKQPVLSVEEFFVGLELL
jgi:adenylate cyclase class IV